MDCVICRNKTVDTEPVYMFPKLPDSHKYHCLHGPVHIECLKKHSEYQQIGIDLVDIYLSFYHDDPDCSISKIKDRIICQNRPHDECIVISNFIDFVEFYIPYFQIKQVRSLSPEKTVPLGINRLSEVGVDQNNLIFIKKIKPPMKVVMTSLNIQELRNILEKYKQS